MVKIYNNTGKIQVKGYGYVPFQYTKGGNIGEILLQSTKNIGKYGKPLVKKAIETYGPDIVETVSVAGQEKLASLLGDQASTRISKEAEKMIKKLVKSSKGKKALAKVKKSSTDLLTKMLSGKGLKLMK
jgi:hypothetical protein